MTDMKTQLLHIAVFAQLKDCLPERFSKEIPENISCAGLLEMLMAEYPDAAPVLKLSRIASEQEIFNNGHLLSGVDKVFVLPPSSGG